MKRRAHNLRIGVLMGGRSTEREVSFNSGRTICDHLDTELYSVVPLFQDETGLLYKLPYKFLHRGKISDFLQRLKQEVQPIALDVLSKEVDFVFLATHGRLAEDGCLQGTLEVLNIPYSGAKILGSALGMHKGFQKKILSSAGITVPAGIILSPKESNAITVKTFEKRRIAAHLSYPLIVKPVTEGSSLGVSYVANADEIIAALHHACTCAAGLEQAVIIEEKIVGKEFSCITVEDTPGSWRALSVTHVIPEKNSNFYCYEQKYMPGRATRCTPAPFPPDQFAAIQKTCCDVSALLEFVTLGRTDGFLTPNGTVVITDPNSLAGTGMGPATFIFTEAAQAGMNHQQFINFLLERELTLYGLIPTHKKTRKIPINKAPLKRIGVLLGGNSNEREVSLESGRNVCYKLSPHKYHVTPIFVDDKMHLYRLGARELIKNSTRDIIPLLTDAMRIDWQNLPHHFDFIFIALHGGYGENGAVQGMLDNLQIPYNGSGVLTSALCMNKYRTNTFLAAQGFSVPRNHVLPKTQWDHTNTDKKRTALFDTLEHTIGFPCILKPYDDGCSTGVIKIHNKEECAKKIETYFEQHHKNHCFFEEYIEGTELTVGCYGNDHIIALPPSKVVVQKDILTVQEKFLPGQGENQTPAPFPLEALTFIRTTIQNVYRAVECSGYARIDCFYQDTNQSPTKTPGIVIIEINTLPALTPATCLFHQAAEVGITPMAFIDTIVSLGRERFAHTIPLTSSRHKHADR